jgi:hypothetical protein
VATIDKAKLRQFFAAFATARVKLPRASGNLYELYIFLTICDAARGARYGVHLQGIVGGTYQVRASPGVIDSRFGYAALTSPRGTQYALRNGIEVVGHSSMCHEADVLLLRATVTSGRPSWKDVALTLECKDYASVTNLKGEARKAVGAVIDMHPLGLLRTFQPIFYPAGFTTNVSLNHRPDILKYLRCYGVRPYFNVAPHQPGEARLSRQVSLFLSRLP